MSGNLTREKMLRTRKPIAMILAAALLYAAAGCGHSSRSGSPGGQQPNASTHSDSHATTPVPPPAPGSLAAAASSSVALVAQLHDTATLLTRHTGLPAGTLTDQAVALRAKLTALAKPWMKAPGYGVQLSDVLSSYADVAAQLKQTSVADRKRLAATLAALDERWKEIVAAIGKQEHLNLLAALPPLLLPR